MREKPDMIFVEKVAAGKECAVPRFPGRGDSWGHREEAPGECRVWWFLGRSREMRRFDG